MDIFTQLTPWHWLALALLLLNPLIEPIFNNYTPIPEGEVRDAVHALGAEAGIPDETVEQLRAMGHNVEVVTNGIMFGGYQAIVRDPETGVYSGATEMRKDGQASGF